MNLLQHVQQTIDTHKQFVHEQLILVALSGGADSVALLLILKELGYNIEALHCNFHLRGEESNRDESFVSDLCARLGIELQVKHFNTIHHAQENKISIEMAARYLRYSWFEERAKQQNAQAIAVAHHRDDQAETVLLNIVRGTGIRGLGGMKYRNGLICRPLLDISRNEIIDYLKLRQQDFVTDSTNLEREATRNKLRLDILPALQEINPSIHETLARLANNVQDALPIYEKGLFKKTPTTCSSFEISPFTISEASLTMLHEWTESYGFSRTQLQNILTAQTGSIVESASHRLLRDRKHFLLAEKGKEYSVPNINYEILPSTEVGKMSFGTAYLDADKIQMPIQVRRTQISDRFVPLGMSGSQLVSDYLTNLKVNRFEKELQGVLTDASGQILWVVGKASSQLYKVTSSTKKVMIVRVAESNKPCNSYD